MFPPTKPGAAPFRSPPFPPRAKPSRAGQVTAQKENRPRSKSEPAKRARASDILLTQDACNIELGWACRAEPGSGVGDVPPRPGAAPFLAHFVASPGCIAGAAAEHPGDIQTVAVLRCKRRERGAGSPALTMPLHRNDGSSPRSAAAASDPPVVRATWSGELSRTAAKCWRQQRDAMGGRRG